MPNIFSLLLYVFFKIPNNLEIVLIKTKSLVFISLNRTLETIKVSFNTILGKNVFSNTKCIYDDNN